MKVDRFAGKAVLLVPILWSASPLPATTWDEPWQEQVLREAETFAQYRVLENKAARLVLKKTRHVAGKETPEEVVVKGFFLLQLGSRSSTDELSIDWDEDSVMYCFLKKARGNTWQLPTPTAGFAEVEEGTVTATYRHSYHKALVSEKIYELTMGCLFKKVHGEGFDEKPVREFIEATLGKPPVKLPEDPEKASTDPFFLQHAALECLYYLGRPDDLDRVRPFLVFDDYHGQISAVRALSGIQTPSARKELLKFLEGDGNGFAKVMAVWGLKRQAAREAIDRLRKIHETASTEEVGFGGRVMDPRVGTSFPENVRAAIAELLEEWTGAVKPRLKDGSGSKQ